MIFTRVAYAPMWRVGGICGGIGVGWKNPVPGPLPPRRPPASGAPPPVLGPIATRLSHVYGVSLAVVGAFVTVQFVMHMVMQIPGGRAADRLGARSSALLGMALVIAGNAISLPAPNPSLAFLGRAVVGI